MKFVFAVFVLIFMMTGCDDGASTCDDGNRLASTIVTRCGSDQRSGVCLHGDGTSRYAGCSLNAGTAAEPDVVECVTSCLSTCSGVVSNEFCYEPGGGPLYDGAGELVFKACLDAAGASVVGCTLTGANGFVYYRDGQPLTARCQASCGG